jgi:uncharacterized membrane protein YeaQ/YmgE (transglycosylase-associated protein family)
MLPSVDELFAWLIVGALAGSLAGILITRKREGLGGFTNLGVGLAGAVLGGLLFKLLKINLGLLAEIKISLQDVVAAFLGSLLFVLIVWFVRRWRIKPKVENQGP